MTPQQQLTQRIREAIHKVEAEPTLNEVFLYIKNKYPNSHFDRSSHCLDLYNLQLPYSQQSDEWFNFMLEL